MKTYTKQETFDIVVRHLLMQKRKSWGPMVDKDGDVFDICKYREGNLRCAAGILIPDKEYREEFEDITAKDLCEKLGMDTFWGHDLRLVYLLQGVHDDYNPSEWRDRLAKLGVEENLDISAIGRSQMDGSTL